VLLRRGSGGTLRRNVTVTMFEGPLQKAEVVYIVGFYTSAINFRSV
jgi:hypothetical protein